MCCIVDQALVLCLEDFMLVWYNCSSKVWQWQDDSQFWRDYDEDAQLVIEVCPAALEFNYLQVEIRLYDSMLDL